MQKDSNASHEERRSPEVCNSDERSKNVLASVLLQNPLPERVTGDGLKKSMLSISEHVDRVGWNRITTLMFVSCGLYWLCASLSAFSLRLALN